jgi:hypothetical protein
MSFDTTSGVTCFQFRKGYMFLQVYAWHSLVLAACHRFQFLFTADRNLLLQTNHTTDSTLHRNRSVSLYFLHIRRAENIWNESPTPYSDLFLCYMPVCCTLSRFWENRWSLNLHRASYEIRLYGGDTNRDENHQTAFSPGWLYFDFH